MKQPAALGWEAKQRKVDLVIERPFQGEELLRRMQGWFTVDVHQVIDIIQQHGKLKVLDGYDLVVETHSQSELETLSENLTEAFGLRWGFETASKRQVRCSRGRKHFFRLNAAILCPAVHFHLRASESLPR